MSGATSSVSTNWLVLLLILELLLVLLYHLGYKVSRLQPAPKTQRWRRIKDAGQSLLLQLTKQY